MKSEQVVIGNRDQMTADALKMADHFIEEETPLTGKKAMHMRLLVEETLGMVRAMAGVYRAVFWIEEENGTYRICLTMKTDMNAEKKAELLSVSKSGKNAAVKGFMGKIGEIIENGLLNYDHVMELQQEYGGGAVNYAYMGIGGQTGGMMETSLYWTLQDYRTALYDAEEENGGAAEAMDELEKSIVASLADDVIVGVKKDKVDITIVKSFAEG